MLAEAVRGSDALSPPGALASGPTRRSATSATRASRRGRSRRSTSRCGTSRRGCSAVPLSTLLGRVRDGVRAYGSGGFTSYDDERLREQLGGWAEQGLTAVKMKVGSEPGPRPGARARGARGDRAGGRAVRGRQRRLRPQAGAVARRALRRRGGRELVRGAGLLGRPRGAAAAARPGSGRDADRGRRVRLRAALLPTHAGGRRGGRAAGRRDPLRRGHGMLGVGALCRARSLELSAHTSPSIHAHVGCAIEPLVHVEYFHDHARIEQMLFEGATVPQDGELHPDPERPGSASSCARTWQSATRPERPLTGVVSLTRQGVAVVHAPPGAARPRPTPALGCLIRRRWSRRAGNTRTSSASTCRSRSACSASCSWSPSER